LHDVNIEILRYQYESSGPSAPAGGSAGARV
jgi:hypothetical protein